MRVAAIGECMIEIAEAPSGQAGRGFGGDTLNTAIYLARLGIQVDYLTALGDDPYSDGMLAAGRWIRWAHQLVLHVDDLGERHALAGIRALSPALPQRKVPPGRASMATATSLRACV